MVLYLGGKQWYFSNYVLLLLIFILPESPLSLYVYSTTTKKRWAAHKLHHEVSGPAVSSLVGYRAEERKPLWNNGPNSSMLITKGNEGCESIGFGRSTRQSSFLVLSQWYSSLLPSIGDQLTTNGQSQ